MQLIHDCILQDGTEKWRRWEELVHLLWMLLLSYNKAMKGEMLVNTRTLCSSICICNHEMAPYRFCQIEENLTMGVWWRTMLIIHNIVSFVVFQHFWVRWSYQNQNQQLSSVLLPGSRQCLEPVGNLRLQWLCNMWCDTIWDCTELFYWIFFFCTAEKEKGAKLKFLLWLKRSNKSWTVLIT